MGVSIGAERSRPPIATVLVVVPARDEQVRIGACLESVGASAAHLALSAPEVVVRVTVVLDRCSDGTPQIAARSGAHTVVVDAGCVGAARRAGAAAAAADLPEHVPASTLLVNTDADCVVGPAWLGELVALAELGRGHDVVLGEVRPDTEEMTPAALAAWWERHPVGQGSLHGANLAVRLDAYHRAGGFPAIADREDAALVRALRADGARCVGGTRVTTSARRDGRVPAGFAGYLRELDAELAVPLASAHPRVDVEDA